MSDDKKKMPVINTRIDGPISKEDYHRQANIADLKASRLLTEKNLNTILYSFQQQQVQKESRFNILWNVLSAIVQYLDDKKILVTGDFVRIGLELSALHKRNMEAIRKATKEKRRVDQNDLEKAPIDRLLAEMESIPTKPTLVRLDKGCDDEAVADQHRPTEPAPPNEEGQPQCGNCGTEVLENATSCPKCGVEFENS